MKREIVHRTSRAEYRAKAVVVWCFDARFSGLLTAFLKQRGFLRHGSLTADLVIIAGGAKALAEAGSGRQFLRSQIAASMRLHATKRIILTVHNNCGAFGGSEDVREYATALKNARKFLMSQFPRASVETCFLDFDGLYRDVK